MLKCDGLVVSFDETTVLHGVSLDVPARGLTGILGPNGSGKTTLLRALSGVLKPQQGVVTLEGKNLRAMSVTDVARRIAVVPQETHLAFDYTVLEMVLMGRYPHLGPFEIEGPDDLASAESALAATGTDHLAGRAFATLSGGEKQRVIIAAALAQLGEGLWDDEAPSRVLLLDEPTSSLDLRYQIEVAQLLRRLHERRDITIVLSTHDVQFAAAVCADLILLSGGRVLAQGPPDAVLTAPQIASLYGIDEAHAAPFAAGYRR
jgi:iron complex transport system ATP-binding protein